MTAYYLFISLQRTTLQGCYFCVSLWNNNWEFWDDIGFIHSSFSIAKMLTKQSLLCLPACGCNDDDGGGFITAIQQVCCYLNHRPTLCATRQLVVDD